MVHRRKEVQLPRLQTLTIVHNGSTARLLVPVQGGSTGRPDWFVKLMLKHYWAVVTGTGCVMMLLLPKGFTGPGPRDSAPRNQAAAAGHLRSRWLLTELLDFALELVVKLSYTMAVTLLFDWALERCVTPHYITPNMTHRVQEATGSSALCACLVHSIMLQPSTAELALQ